MKPLYIAFEKLEFGTLFYDPTTEVYYRKVSETEAELEDNDLYNRRMRVYLHGNDKFRSNEMVVV